MNWSLVWILLMLCVVHTQAQGECRGDVSPADSKCFGDKNEGHSNKPYCASYANNIMWYYDWLIQSCRQFAYKGCGGNKNRFCSREACEKECQRSDKAHII